jgi:Uma2 family endonuclease
MPQQLLKERPSAMSVADYQAFLAARPKEERWQLIDGEAFMMTPPTGTHQRIAYNLARRLDDALDAGGLDLATLQEIGVRIPGRDAFLPIPDLVVADAIAPTDSYLEKFYLAAEVLSESNTFEYVSLKVGRYAEHPDNLYTLVIDQAAMHCEIWARRNNWKGIVLRGPEETIELPEFNFRCLLQDLYRNTRVLPI